MNIGSRELFTKNAQNLPYDKELKWLGGANGICCPLNVQLTKDTGFKIVIERTKDDTSDVVAFGARSATDTRWFVGGWRNGSVKQWYFGYGTRYDYGTMRMNEVVEMELNFMNSRKARFNGIDVASLAAQSGSEGLSLYFPAYNNISIRTEFEPYYRYHSFTLTKGTEVLFDLIPVKVGNVGHFYDKISKRLLLEVGSAKFVVGPDKV